jgi:signal transduction histidine kinase
MRGRRSSGVDLKLEPRDKEAIMARHNDKMPVKTALTAYTRGGWDVVSHRPRWLVAVWASLFALSMVVLLLYVVGTPVYFAQVSTLCKDCLDEHLTSAKVQALRTLGISITAYATYWTVVNLLFALVYCAIAAFLFWRKSDDRMALIACFALVVMGVAFPSIPNALAAVRPAWWLPVTLLEALGLPSLTVFLFLFPTGRFVPLWTRWVAVGFAALYMLSTFFPGSVFSFAHWPRLLTLPLPLVWLGSLVFAQVYRFRRVSTAVERQQTKWVVFSVVIALLGFLLLAFLPLAFLPLLFPGQSLTLLPSVFVITSVYLLLLLIPISVAFAILRYRLWDIDIIISRTLVYGALTVCVICLYALVVGMLGVLFQAQGNVVISLFATGLIALLFSPLRDRLQQAVNRLMYGERDDPYRVISRLGQRLEATLAPEAVLPTIVETVAQTLKLPYAVITLKQESEFTIAASYGVPTDELVRLPLNYHTEQIGELILAPRGPSETFSSADRELLSELARQAGIAAHAVRLTADLKHLTSDLQQSRQRLVTAREEERRRLRRDLHDELGPTLATITLKAEAARDAIAMEPAEAIALLEELIGQAQSSITDIRRLVYNLRPPALDDLGLIAAMRTQATQYERTGLHVTLDAPKNLPELPAAVEVATYRIMQEALTNIVRHAAARSCFIRLTFDDGLHLEITDDGRGIPADREAGVGLRSMQERAEEVGGSCIVEALPTKGTRVQVRLPCISDKAHRWQETA